jgi:hypothetical protein
MFKSNSTFLHFFRYFPVMSLNRYEQTLFNYIDRHAEERRFWHGKLHEVVACHAGDVIGAGREVERELWHYYSERSEHVPALRELNTGGLRRISLLNLADYLLRLWGPPPKPKKKAPPEAPAEG